MGQGKSISNCESQQESLIHVTKRTEAIGLDEDQCQSFYSQGYLKLNAVLEGGALSRVQSEFRRVEEATREAWLESVAAGLESRPYRLGETAHVVFPVAPHGDVFVDLLEHPQTMAVAEAFMGPDMLKAGDALLWNGCILHAAMDNTGGQARRMLIYNYVHFGQNQYVPCRATGDFKERIQAISPLCRCSGWKGWRETRKLGDERNRVDPVRKFTRRWFFRPLQASASRPRVSARPGDRFLRR